MRLTAPVLKENSMTTTSHAIEYSWNDAPDAPRQVLTRSEGTKVIHLEVIEGQICEPLPAGAMLLDDFLDAFDLQDDVKRHLKAARVEVGAKLSRTADGATIRSLRLGLGMSQRDLAEQIGTTQSRVSRIESRRERPAEDTIRKLRSALQIDFNTLMDALARAGE